MLAEIGVYFTGTEEFNLDANGNGQWDTEARGDLVLGPFGNNRNDRPIVGDWDGDGLDEIGFFVVGQQYFYQDLNSNGVWDGIGVDRRLGPFGQFGDVPVIGDWDGDGDDEIGVYRHETRLFYLDINGDGEWDGVGVDRRLGPFGNPRDQPIIGDWDGDGDDEVGVFRPRNNIFYLDRNGDGAWDGTTVDERRGPFGSMKDLGEVGDRPIIGDWDEDGDDEIGIYHGFQFDEPNFRLDLDGNGQFDCFDAELDFRLSGIALVGDWVAGVSLNVSPGGPLPEVSAPGSDNVGVFDQETLSFYLDANGNRRFDGGVCGDVVLSGRFANPGDLPIAGDWDGNGKDEIGVFRPRNNLFYLDLNGNGVWDGIGVDRRLGPFGIAGDLPLVGDWGGDGDDEVGVFRPRNQLFYLDLNGNGAWDGRAIDRRQGPFVADGDMPGIAGDWDGDGKDEIGVLRPNQNVFLFDVNGNGVWNGTVVDRRIQVFLNGLLELVGDWDGNGDAQIGSYEAPFFNLDLDNDGDIDARPRFLGDAGDLPVIGNWALPLLAAEGSVVGDGASLLTTDALAPIVEQAVFLWNGVALTAAQRTALEQVQVDVGQLPGALLGLATGTSIVLDADAAGYGWFVDDTPDRSEEYRREDGQLRAAAGSVAGDHMDLLSAVIHELGHIVGRGHNVEGMFEELAIGVRQLPAAFDAVFAE